MTESGDSESADERFRREFPGAAEVFDLIDPGGSGAGSTDEVDPAPFTAPIGLPLSHEQAAAAMERLNFDDTAQLRTDLEQVRGLLTRLSQWDHFDSAGDGPYWREEIAKVLQ